MRHRILTVISGLCVLFGVILALPGCSSSKETAKHTLIFSFPVAKCWFREKLRQLGTVQMVFWVLRLMELSIRHTA